MAYFDHNGRATFPFPRAEVFRAVCDAVGDLDGFELVSRDGLGGRITVRTRMNLRTWGETIPITVRESSPGECEVLVESSPKIGALGVLDWGRNKGNIEAILGGVAKRLRHAKRSAPANSAHAAPSGTTSDALSLGIAARLRTLQDLLAQGLINPEDFERRKAEILRDV